MWLRHLGWFPIVLTHVPKVFATRYPRYLLRIVNKHEEFYAFIMFFVERYYLRKHSTHQHPGATLTATYGPLVRCIVF